MTSQIWMRYFLKFYCFKNLKTCILAYFRIFLFLSRHDTRTSFWRYQPIWSQKLGCKTNLSLLPPSLLKNWPIQDQILGLLHTKINNFFSSKKADDNFYKVLENVTLSTFSYFIVSYPVPHGFFVILCCIQSYVKHVWKKILYLNKNIAKNLEKQQFSPCHAGTFRSQKI